MSHLSDLELLSFLSSLKATMASETRNKEVSMDYKSKYKSN